MVASITLSDVVPSSQVAPAALASSERATVIA